MIDEIDYFTYVQEIETVYRDSRWEAYYDLAIIPLLRMCCYKGTKIVPTHETRNSGRPRSKTKKHFIETYSIVDENGKRCGIPDYVIVPSSSTYDIPQKAYLTIEFKLPKILPHDYIEERPEKYKMELIHQLEYCEYCIFTDGVTWHFLKKTVDNTLKEELSAIKLYDEKSRSWKVDERKIHSDSETNEIHPQEWSDLKESIRKFISFGIS